MRNPDRSKKVIHLWKKALLHFSLCFIMGFFTGFAPASPIVSPLSTRHPSANIRSIKISEVENKNRGLEPSPTINITSDNHEPEGEFSFRQQLIIVTTADSQDPLQEAFFWRLAQTLRLVRPPLLWIIVEAGANAPVTEKKLRLTGVMYRHITYKENFTAADTAQQQKNIALNHVEHHRLDGIVHFAGAFNIYTVQFFEEIRVELVRYLEALKLEASQIWSSVQ